MRIEKSVRQISIWYKNYDRKVRKLILNMAWDLEPPTLEAPTLAPN